MSTETRNSTKPLRLRDYVSTAGQLNMTKLTDAALEAFEAIRMNGQGRHQNRSRGVIVRSYRTILEASGFSGRDAQQAVSNLREIDDLNTNANE